MKRFPLFVVAVTLTAAIATGAWASKSSQNFIREATTANQFEISASRLALQNSQNDGVKQFAQQMIDDHSQVGNRLKAVISSSDAELKEPAISLDQDHQDMLDKLQKLSGAEFDKEYIREQIKAHDDAVSLFKKYAKSGDNDGLKTFAAETLPTLREHQHDVGGLMETY